MDQIRILLVEDSPEDYRLTRELLRDIEGVEFDLLWETTYEGGLRAIETAGADVVLVDDRLGVHSGLDLVTEAVERQCGVPVILLTGLADRATDLEAMRRGAADFLVKGEVSGRTLERAIRYSVRQHRLLEEIRALSLVDELTGLYNRRGFQTLAEQQIRIATRMQRDLVVLFADVDGLKHINDELGHAAGDQVIREMAELLRTTFRESDVVARLGGDEFGVLVLEAAESALPPLLERLEQRLDERNAAVHPLYRFGISVGAVGRQPGDERGFEELVSAADERMYRSKRGRRARLVPGPASWIAAPAALLALP